MEEVGKVCGNRKWHVTEVASENVAYIRQTNPFPNRTDSPDTGERRKFGEELKVQIHEEQITLTASSRPKAFKYSI